MLWLPHCRAVLAQAQQLHCRNHSCTVYTQQLHCKCTATPEILTQEIFAVQELFLRSPCPTAALQMRKDLRHWPQALSLAHQLDPTQVPGLACSYAQVGLCFLAATACIHSSLKKFGFLHRLCSLFITLQFVVLQSSVVPWSLTAWSCDTIGLR